MKNNFLIISIKNKDNIIDEKITLTIENKPKFIFNLEKSDNYKYHYSKKKTIIN